MFKTVNAHARKIARGLESLIRVLKSMQWYILNPNVPCIHSVRQSGFYTAYFSTPYLKALRFECAL